jgi:hypothetical protein
MEEALAEDLLRAAPDVRSDVGGELAVRFMRPDKTTLAVVALKVVVAFWGRRARALLLGALDSTVDPVRLAALDALQRLGSLDDWTIDRLGRILTNPGSVELRVAAASTLTLAPTEGRARVVAFLQERLHPQGQGLVGSLLSKAFGPKEDEEVVVALAGALVTLDPGGARQVLDKVMVGRPELRSELEALLARRSIPPPR